MDIDALSPDMIQRWLLLRSIEWMNWPAFLSQLVAPILLIFFSWVYVIGAVLLFGILWCLIRYKVVSVRLANTGAITVVWLKWPIALGSAIYLFNHDQIGIGFLALLWPMFAGLLGIPGKVGVVERAFGIKIGLTSLQ